MRKTYFSLMIILGTALYVLTRLLASDDAPVEARIVTVQRGDVHQVVAISGKIAFADETVIYAPANTSVAHILVEPGQRVATGEALMRFTSELTEVAAAAISHQEVTEKLALTEVVQRIDPVDDTVLRTEDDCTVRQVLVTENTPVMAGSPLLRTTSNQQEIVCAVSKADVKKIKAGMWAWISAEGEEAGKADVVRVGDLSADPMTGMTSATVTLHPEQHLELPEGAAVDVDIYLAGSDDVLTLPVEAVTADNTVWWVNEGRCTEIPVEIVMTDEILAWVMLPEGIKVAVGEFVEGQRVVEAAP